MADLDYITLKKIPGENTLDSLQELIFILVTLLQILSVKHFI